MSVHLYGIRHHGPGSARHLQKALKALQPDILLIEGPPEADALLKWATSAEMKPPVAILAYVPDNPQQAVFYPFAQYSPEWQAILYGIKQQIPVRFMDMPVACSLARMAAQSVNPEETPPPDFGSLESSMQTEPDFIYRQSPFADLAEIAGYRDPEEWWEQHFELSEDDPESVFLMLREAIRELRAEKSRPDDVELELREAFMRQQIRKAENEMYQKIAVVCGAWHLPALETFPPAKADLEKIKKTEKVKTECTWIPWTNARLTMQSGYGAGIESPGWYNHVWQFPQDDGSRWLSRTARVFRENQKDISSAHVIEALRLSASLSQLRGLKTPGLAEFTESTQAVMCMGDSEPLVLLNDELIVGHAVGAIPEDAPQSPLQKDFEQQHKKLRLKISDVTQSITLDLRSENDLKKSIFLHRLNILGVTWGQTTTASGKGTFKEAWNLRWEPEMMIGLVDKSARGNTVQMAANQYLAEQAESCTDIESITQWLNQSILAELQSATGALLQKLDQLAASTGDIPKLLNAALPLAEIIRYGNVRKTDKESTERIFYSIFYRVVAGLPPACCNIDEEAARILASQILEMNKTLGVLNQTEITHDWLSTLNRIQQNEHSAPFIGGAVNKLLYQQKYVATETTARAFSKALSAGTEKAHSADWLEGFLQQSATILILDTVIWGIIYDWVDTLSEEDFMAILPILRRTFSSYLPAEKQKIARLVLKGNSANNGQQIQEFEQEINAINAVKPVALIEKLLGLNKNDE